MFQSASPPPPRSFFEPWIRRGDKFFSYPRSRIPDSQPQSMFLRAKKQFLDKKLSNSLSIGSKVFQYLFKN